MEYENTSEQSKNKPMRVKKIYEIEISEFELFCIRMISDYLFLDRFNDCASFVRFEQCFVFGKWQVYYRHNIHIIAFLNH